MSLKALRRLSETELSGLRTALDTVAAAEAELIRRLDRMRRASLKEYQIRGRMGLPGPGEFAAAYAATLDVVKALTAAREETTPVVTNGRIEKREDG